MTPAPTWSDAYWTAISAPRPQPSDDLDIPARPVLSVVLASGMATAATEVEVGRASWVTAALELGAAVLMGGVGLALLVWGLS